MSTAGAGVLYIVSTPIGNLGDFTFRAVEVLSGVAAVLAEDTRHTRILMMRYEISTPLIAYHEHNEARTIPSIVTRLAAGEQLALVSDAGTPLLSDPGMRLVRAAADAGIIVTAVPGASALLAALVTSGLALDRFTFFGFLARKGAERRSALDEIVRLEHAAVVYEAPSRVGATLAELAAAGCGERETVVARELTKQHEEIRRGTLAQLATYYEDAPPRGEIVIVINGARAADPVSEDELRVRAGQLRTRGLSSRDIVAALVTEMGAARNVAYRLAHE